MERSKSVETTWSDWAHLQLDNTVEFFSGGPGFFQWSELREFASDRTTIGSVTELMLRHWITPQTAILYASAAVGLLTSIAITMPNGLHLTIGCTMGLLVTWVTKRRIEMSSEYQWWSDARRRDKERIARENAPRSWPEFFADVADAFTRRRYVHGVMERVGRNEEGRPIEVFRERGPVIYYWG